MDGLIFLIILPLLTAFSLGIVKRYFKAYLDGIVLLSFTIHLFLSLRVVIKALQDPIIYKLGDWDIPLGISLMVDSFSAMMILLISCLAYLIMIYSIGFIKEKKVKYYILFLFLVAGMMGMVMTADLFNLYVFFEITSIASYALAVFNKKDASIEAGFKYLIIGTVGGVFVLLGIILTYQMTGSLNLAQIALKFSSLPRMIRYTIFSFYLIGFGTKAALVPLHTWMPDVYSYSLASFSALSSALIIKVSLYSLIRISYTLFGVEFITSEKVNFILIFLGVITFLVAHLLAYQQKSLRRLLGYSSIAQMGYLLLAFSLGTEKGIISANYHLLNHAVIKSTLFLGAGIFTLNTGSYGLEGLKGLGKRLPYISLVFSCACFAIIGLPPFNGFISKWLLVEALLEKDHLVVSFLILVGTVLSLLYYLRVIKFLYSESEGEIQLRNINWKMKFSTILLGSFCLWLGIFPDLPLSLIEKTVSILKNI